MHDCAHTTPKAANDPAQVQSDLCFMNTHNLQQKKVIVAGGTSGIGLATAKALAAEGALVTVTGRDPNKLKDASASGLDAQSLDSMDRSALDTFFKGFGSLDHLVITIGSGKGMGNFADLDLVDLKDAYERKFWPLLNTVQAALPYIRPTGSVTIVTAASSRCKLSGTSGLAGINGGLELMMEIWAKELKPIRFNAVSPGLVDTPWWDHHGTEAKAAAFKSFSAQIPVGRVAEPEEIADAIQFLVGNEYMTGKVIVIDGGIS
jgi:NAD(P)-dependent dehydrogenase (short-subunit alcohol dehydrogenase family)